MAILFAVMAIIVMLRDLALFGPEFFVEFVVNNELTNEKISLVMFGIAGVIFAIGVSKSKQLYRES